MTQNLTGHYVTQFTSNMQLLLQQKQSALRPFVDTGAHVGSAAVPVDQIGKVEALSVTSRFAPITDQDIPTDRRWVYPQDKRIATLIDHFDKLRLLADPMSGYSQSISAGMNRSIDDIIIAGMFNSANTGVAGGTAVPFATANQVSVNVGGTASGLNVAKLRKARQLMMSYFVDPSETIYCAVTSKQIDNLLNEVQVVSSDFNMVKPLVDGVVTRFMGITFIPCERLTVDASSYRRVPVWVKSGVHLGIWNDVRADLTQRKDLEGLPWQLYTDMTIGATRLEENKIIELPCAES
jgi:hypothetical protein